MARQKTTPYQVGAPLFTYSATGSATPTTTESQQSYPTAITFTLSAAATVEISTMCYVTITSVGSRLLQNIRVTNTAGAIQGVGSYNAAGGSSWNDQGTVQARAILSLTAGSYTYVVTDVMSSSTATTTYRTIIARIIGT